MTEQEFIIKQVVDEMLLPVIERITTLEKEIKQLEEAKKALEPSIADVEPILDDYYQFKGGD